MRIALCMLVAMVLPVAAQDVKPAKADLARLLEEKTAEVARLNEEVKKLLGRIAELTRAAAPATKAEPRTPGEELEQKLDRVRVTVDFAGHSVPEALAFLTELTGTEHQGDERQLSGLTLSLRVRDVSLRTLLELVALNVCDEAGESVDLTWTREESVVVFARK